jgi:hypothetical protein
VEDEESRKVGGIEDLRSSAARSWAFQRLELLSMTFACSFRVEKRVFGRFLLLHTGPFLQ